MTSALLALTLAVSDHLGFPPVAEAALPASSTPAAQASPALPAAAPLPSAPPPLVLPTAGPALGGLILPACGLLALAAVTLLLARRRRQAPGLVQILETTSLGPKRSLVVARLGGEVLLLGASEAGIQLLAARPAADALPSAQAVLPALRAVAQPPPAGSLLSLLGRLRRRPPPPAALHDTARDPSFDALLDESAEDQELRRKLARGQAGSVR